MVLIFVALEYFGLAQKRVLQSCFLRRALVPKSFLQSCFLRRALVLKSFLQNACFKDTSDVGATWSIGGGFLYPLSEPECKMRLFSPYTRVFILVVIHYVILYALCSGCLKNYVVNNNKDKSLYQLLSLLLDL